MRVSVSRHEPSAWRIRHSQTSGSAGSVATALEIGRDALDVVGMDELATGCGPRISSVS